MSKAVNDSITDRIETENDPIAARIAAESSAYAEEKRAAFAALYAGWLATRGKLAEDNDDAEVNRLLERLDQIQQQIIGAPAALAYQVHWKIEILEAMGEGEWLDRRNVAMLGSIKADLMAFGFGI